MAWTVVETPNAKYVLIFFSPRKAERVPEKFDALVLEMGKYISPAAIWDSRYKNVVEQAVEKGKQIWLTDASITTRSLWRRRAGIASLASIAGVLPFLLLLSAGKEKMPRRAFIKRAIAWGILSSSWVVPISRLSLIHKKEIKHDATSKVTAKFAELILGYGLITARNLLTAEKCEGFLAPKLQQELGRKPTIAMLWEQGHYGIKDLLLHPEKRARLLQKYKLEKFVNADYPKSWRIKLEPDGRIGEIREFSETLKIKKPKAEQPKPQQRTGMLTRRRFLAQMFRKRRL